MIILDIINYLKLHCNPINFFIPLKFQYLKIMILAIIITIMNFESYLININLIS